MSETENTQSNQKRGLSAFALQYSAIDELPQLVASGRGESATKIIQAAQEAGIPISKDQGLAELLKQLPVGNFISPNMYKLVASVISFLYHTDNEWRDKHEFLSGVFSSEETALNRTQVLKKFSH
ncbi:MAG: EscU/YscU/HrcU family type III secretion system export apparatus switch protein [Bdellovibrionales bacterium]|nr:EscU/YscU/HrcU family type III secretion system export apparatus switch protein [Bdellovibrionales bacterium]